jgi:hypothetical protein
LEWVGFVVTMSVVFVYTVEKFVWVKEVDSGGNVGWGRCSGGRMPNLGGAMECVVGGGAGVDISVIGESETCGKCGEVEKGWICVGGGGGKVVAVVVVLVAAVVVVVSVVPGRARFAHRAAII